MTDLTTTAASPKSSGDVVVIGGGLAGVTAALALARAGRHVTLLEAKRRLGGRAGSFTTTNAQGDEEVIDYCQHVGMGCCHGLRQLISWLGQQEYWEEHQQLHFFGPEGAYRRLSAAPLLPAPFHLAGWLIRWPGLNFTDRCAVAYGMWRIRGVQILDKLDEISAIDWLRTNRQTPRAIDHFWSTIIVSALGEQLDRVSLAAVCKVLQDGFLNHRESFHLLVPKRPLDKLFNEMAMSALCELNVDVRLSAAASKVESGEHRVRIHCGPQILEAESVISAVPWHQASRLAWVKNGAQIAGFAKLGRELLSSPITGVHTWWSTDWLPTPHATIVGRLCQWVFPKSEQHSQTVGGKDDSKETQCKENVHYYQIVISGSRDLAGKRSEDLGRLIQDDLAHVFPAVKDSRLLRYKAVTDPQAVFSVVPGALIHRPPVQTTVENVWLAGDWTRTGWPSTMEGAILSGLEAAESVLVGHKPQPVTHTPRTT